MANFACTWIDMALDIAMTNPRVFLAISGWKPKYLPSSLLSYLNGPLQTRILFGTDYPMIRHRDWMRDFNETLKPRLKPGVAENLMRRNAEKLLGS